MTKTSFPTEICISVSEIAATTASADVDGGLIISATSSSMTWSFSPRRERSDASCSVVLGTYDPATMRPPSFVDLSMRRSCAKSGEMPEFPSRHDTNAAPVRYRYFLPACWAVYCQYFVLERARDLEYLPWISPPTKTYMSLSAAAFTIMTLPLGSKSSCSTILPGPDRISSKVMENVFSALNHLPAFSNT